MLVELLGIGTAAPPLSITRDQSIDAARALCAEEDDDHADLQQQGLAGDREVGEEPRATHRAIVAQRRPAGVARVTNTTNAMVTGVTPAGRVGDEPGPPVSPGGQP